MEVPINLIKPSPNPVRRFRDENKIKELAESIAKRGVLQPIKVRPIGIKECSRHGFETLYKTITNEMEGCLGCNDLLKLVWINDLEPDDIPPPVFEIVYGARRWEAAGLVGLEIIPVSIQELSDSEAKLEGLIENIQRENMSDLEIAEGIEALCQTAYLKNLFDITSIQQKEICTAIGLSVEQVRRYINMLKPGRVGLVAEFYKEDPNVLDVKTKSEYIVAKIPHDLELQKAVARKVVREELGQNKTHRLAESVAAAPTEQAKKKLLEWEYSPTIHDPELIKQRTKTHGAHDPIYRDNNSSPQKQFDDTPETRAMLDGFTMALSTFTELMKEMQKMSTVGKLAPEGKQFMAHKLRSFRDKINTLIDELEMTNG